MSVYKQIMAPELEIKIHGEIIKAKPFNLDNKWLNVSKSGTGFYFILDTDGKRANFISVDNLTANDRYWLEYCNTSGGNKKVSCKGYLYISEEGYTHYAIKNVSNFKCFASTNPKIIVPDAHFDNERKHTKEDLNNLITDIDDVFFD